MVITLWLVLSFVLLDHAEGWFPRRRRRWRKKKGDQGHSPAHAEVNTQPRVRIATKHNVNKA